MSQTRSLLLRKTHAGGLWIFDDPEVDLVAEPFVPTATEIIDRLLAGRDIPAPEAGFLLVFSSEPFAGAQVLERVESGYDEGRGGLELAGTWTRYRWVAGDLIGDLCPNLFRYFASPPERIYVRCDAAGSQPPAS